MNLISFIFTVLAVIGIFLAWYLGTIFRKMLPEFGLGNTGARLVLASAIYTMVSVVVYILLAFEMIGGG